MRARGEVERALGTTPLIALVNNAGIPAAGPLELFPLDELRQILEVNLIGAVAVTQAFLALLKASRGRIVNISSVAGRGALPFLGPYAASKFGLEAISDSLRRELLPFGVRVIVIEPGSFKTAIWSKVEAMDLRRYAGTPYESVLDRFRRAVLRGAERAPPPDKVVRAVERALTARRPPLRVIVTPHGWLDRIPLWIPDRWLDGLIHPFSGAGCACRRPDNSITNDRLTSLAAGVCLRLLGRADPKVLRRFAMRGRLMFGVGTLAAALAAGSCKDDVGLTSIPPAPERYLAFLSGANEPTPIATAAQGLATVTVNGDSIHYRIELSQLDNAFLAHIHPGGT